MAIQGTPVVPGIGTGEVIVPGSRPVAPNDEPFIDEATTVADFTKAARAVSAELERAAHRATGAASEVLLANAAMAIDTGLASFVTKNADRGPVAATTAAVDSLAALFENAGGLLAERVTDLLDVRDRIVAELLGLPAPGVADPLVPSVLFAEDLAPADTAGLDPKRVLAIATAKGGTTSHTAIIARQLGIPCVVGVEGLPWDNPPATALVDGSTGDIELEPDPVEAASRIQADTERRCAAATWSGHGATSDGHRIQLLANVQDAEGARVAASQPIEGFGLYRTELSFLDRPREPAIAEQSAVYSAVFGALDPGSKVVVRTLDAGSDKPLAFAHMGTEANPALGIRGLRIAQRRPDLLTNQLHAIAQAADASSVDVHVMAPMVSVPHEAAEFAEKVHALGLNAGVMIETPSAALLIDRIFEHVDFVSIGTNDLSQYTFAADRQAAELAALTDPWQPALLVLIAQIAEAGRRVDKPVGVCGEAAADPALACVLTGLGVTSLSCAAPAVRPVGATLATVTFAQCRAAADIALAGDSPADTRRRVAAVLAEGASRFE